MGDSREVQEPERLTLGVIFYNQEAFAEQAVQGALAQTYSPLEIIFSDDASMDNTFGVIQRAIEGYDGPHKVVLNRNEKNLGLVGNVNRLVELATGEIIVLAGGDDVSMPNRAARSADVLGAESDCLCVSFGTIHFNGMEMPTKVDAHQPEVAYTRYTMSDYVEASSFSLDGATSAYRKQAFDFFGPIATDCSIEDAHLVLRCLLLGDVLTTDEPQVLYRVHEHGLSQFDNGRRFDRVASYRQYVRDLDIAVEHGLLADDERDRLKSVLALRRDRKVFAASLHFASNRLVVLKMIAETKVYRGRRKLRLLLGALRPWKHF